MVVGAVLPAGRPDQLVEVGKALELRSRDIGDAMGDTVDQMKPPADVADRSLEAE